SIIMHASTKTPNTDWMSTEDKILSMTNDQLQTEMPPLMRTQGFSEEEIHRALQIVVEFRDRHQMPIIE
ncbi:MAG: hypothetical protein GY761_07420, partial [Hyphomicrobiales bacterium]|nr:hypothetical protein [Hyphomicrobiales bacterium]